jgi:hypothetical protein
MEEILLILLILIILACGHSRAKSSGGCNVKNSSKTKRPNVHPAPQPPVRNKQGRTKDEQELHEWLEDNPR